MYGVGNVQMRPHDLLQKKNSFSGATRVKIHRQTNKSMVNIPSFNHTSIPWSHFRGCFSKTPSVARRLAQTDWADCVIEGCLRGHLRVIALLRSSFILLLHQLGETESHKGQTRGWTEIALDRLLLVAPALSWRYLFLDFTCYSTIFSFLKTIPEEIFLSTTVRNIVRFILYHESKVSAFVLMLRNPVCLWWRHMAFPAARWKHDDQRLPRLTNVFFCD